MKNSMRIFYGWFQLIVFRYLAIGYLIGLFTPFEVWGGMIWWIWAYRGRLYLVTDDVEHFDDEPGFWDDDEDGSYDVFSAIISPIPTSWLWNLGSCGGLPVLTTIKVEHHWVDRREIRRTLSRLRTHRCVN